MNEVEKLIDVTYLGNTLWEWSIAAAIVVGVFAVLLFVRRLVRGQYDRLAATPEVELMELPLKVISRTTVLFVLIASVYAGLQAVEVQAKLRALATTIFTIAAFWQAGLWATTAVIESLQRRARKDMQTDRAAIGTLGIIGFIARVTIWAFVLLLTLDNLGIQIKPLLAGLGIGGVAVALALQNVLGDLFASLAITLDRPFVVGDSIGVDDFSGTVEYIGVKSTRMRSVNGEQIVMPNSNLTSSRMRNHSRLLERRVVLILNLSQDTPPAKLAELPKLLRALIESQQNVRFDRSHFSKIGASSFDVETIYFITKPDYGLFMDIQQTVNLKILETMEQHEISLSFPVSQLRLDREGGVDSELVAASRPSDPGSGKPE